MTSSASNSIASGASTPTRDNRLPFPPSLHPSPSAATTIPHRSATAPSISSVSSSSSGLPLSAPSVPSTSAVSANAPVTVDSLLALHATAPNPVLAALDQAITDRNTFSSQNSQLWKLIEKQRAGYNQILKELERVRTERDGWKNKLAATHIGNTGQSGSGGDKRKQGSTDRERERERDRERTVKQSAARDTTGGGPSESGSSSGDHHSSKDPRHTMARHHSDDQRTPRTATHHQIHASRSQEPISTRERTTHSNSNSSSNSSSNSTSSLNVHIPPPPSSAPSSSTSISMSTSAYQSSTSSSSRPQKLTPTPLIVPPRSESLPVAASPSAVSHSPEAAPFGRQYSSSSANNGVSADGHSAGPSGSGTGNGRLPYPRKSSLVDSLNGGGSYVAPTVNLTRTQTPPPQSQYHSRSPSQTQQQGTITPHTAPAGFGESLSHNNHPPQSQPQQPQPQSQTQSQRLPHSRSTSHSNSQSISGSSQTTQTQNPNQTTSQAPTLLQPLSSHSQPQIQMQSLASTAPNNNSMLSAIMESRPHALSRESRISLPDEAKQYIANMGESPVPSPRVDVFARDQNEAQQQSRPMGEFGVNGHAGEVANIGQLGQAQGPPLVTIIPASVSKKGRAEDTDPAQIAHSEFLDMEDEEGADDEGDEDVLPPPQSQPQPQQPLQGKRSKARAAVEDFPLPPSNAQAQAQAQAVAQAQAQQTQSQHHAQAMASAEEAHRQQMSDGSGTSQLGSEHPSSETLNTGSTPSQQSLQPQAATGAFRALPLLSTDLPHTTITVSQSFVRPNDRGKEVLSFIVVVSPGNGKEGWKVEKMYSDVLALDSRVRNTVGKGLGKRIVNLPDGKLWKDHAPAKVDQRKAVLENYLQTLINLPVKNNDEVIAFFTSDIMRDTNKPVLQAGHKEGYLTKRGKNFGGWKTRYFVLQGPVLEYYDCRGGAHLGSILVTGAQIGRQQRSGERPQATDEEKEYRHAFLIVEAKKGPGGNHPRHVLCAESDDDRDSWVEMLVRYFSGTYSEEPLAYGPSSVPPGQQAGAVYQNGSGAVAVPRSSSSIDLPTTRRPARGMSRDDISISKGPAVPISQLAPDPTNAKLFQTAAVLDEARSSSPVKSIDPSPTERHGAGSFSDTQTARRILERGQGLSSSLPDSSSPLANVSSSLPLESLSSGLAPIGQRSNSEMGHYPDLQDHRGGRHQRQHSPEQHRTREPHPERKSYHPTLGTVASSPTTTIAPSERVPSPEKLDANGKVKISGPLNGAPIPAGYKFGGKDAPPESSSAAIDRREKAKSRSFWGFGRPNDKSHQTTVAYIPRAVFGVQLEESLDVAQIANLPAIVFRSIQYLEAKKADQEEGIYRLSGSSAVIKSLKDRFNMEGDVNLLASDEYWDPHAIAGLLKSFLRELPASILTRDLHLKFLAVIDFVDAQERIKELSQLIAALPIANYSLLRALTAHLILIVQNSSVNKMTMRNVGIVFSPTLGIPAGVFSLMLGEFNRVFNVDADNEEPDSPAQETGEGEGGSDRPSEMSRRNSRQYSDAAADQLLGLSGRTLTTSAEEALSDGDDFSVQDESSTETTEGDATVESSSGSSPGSGSTDHDQHSQTDGPGTPTASKSSSKASHVAATRGLNVAVTQSDRGNRYSRMMGLPASPRPPPSPSRPPDIPSPNHTPTQ